MASSRKKGKKFDSKYRAKYEIKKRDSPLDIHGIAGRFLLGTFIFFSVFVSVVMPISAGFSALAIFVLLGCCVFVLELSKGFKV